MKFLFFLFILFLSFNLHAQISKSGKPDNTKNIKAVKKCLLEFSQLPLFHGVRLGMEYEEVSEIYPEIKENSHFHKTFDVEKKGLFMIEGAKLSNLEFRQDVEQISLNFSDNKVIVIALVYDSNKWTSIYDSIGSLSSIFQVDNNYWSIINDQSAEMNCSDFNIYTNHQTSGQLPPQNSMSIHRVQNK